MAEKSGKKLDDFTMEEFKQCSDLIEDDIYKAISMETCVEGRNIIGGPAKERTEKEIEAGYEFLDKE